MTAKNLTGPFSIDVYPEQVSSLAQRDCASASLIARVPATRSLAQRADKKSALVMQRGLPTGRPEEIVYANADCARAGTRSPYDDAEKTLRCVALSHVSQTPEALPSPQTCVASHQLTLAHRA